jgi:hypothetical protein
MDPPPVRLGRGGVIGGARVHRKSTTLLWALLAVGLALPPCALAQDRGASSGQAAPAMPEDPRAPRFHEVERGGFVGFETGWLTLLKTPTADRTRASFAGAGGGRADLLLVGVEAGYDVTERIALAAFALDANGGASPSYGSFNVFAAGGDVRLALFGARDGQGVERLYGYLHARGGWLFTRPVGLFGTTALYASGGPGIEYFTRLRHFSVGAAFDVAYVSKAATLGFAVFPTVRYTF